MTLIGLKRPYVLVIYPMSLIPNVKSLLLNSSRRRRPTPNSTIIRYRRILTPGRLMSPPTLVGSQVWLKKTSPMALTVNLLKVTHS